MQTSANRPEDPADRGEFSPSSAGKTHVTDRVIGSVRDSERTGQSGGGGPGTAPPAGTAGAQRRRPGPSADPDRACPSGVSLTLAYARGRRYPPPIALLSDAQLAEKIARHEECLRVLTGSYYVGNDHSIDYHQAELSRCYEVQQLRLTPCLHGL